MSIENLTGQTLGKYRLNSLIGKGGMSAVYRARDEQLARDVAIKVLAMRLSENENAIERFIREAKTVAALEHPGIVPIYEYDTERDITYVVMRYLPGGTLADKLQHMYLHDEPPFELSFIAKVLDAIAEALDHAHAQGVIHRDIKPTNIMFDKEERPLLVDFGIVKLLDSSEKDLTELGARPGTPRFMAPEQWRNEAVSPATDQYALGAVIYTMLTGHVPFDAPTNSALMYQHLDERPPAAHLERSDVDENMTQVINKAMAKRSQNRYKSVGEFARAFRRAARLEVPATDETPIDDVTGFRVLTDQQLDALNRDSTKTDPAKNPKDFKKVEETPLPVSANKTTPPAELKEESGLSQTTTSEPTPAIYTISTPGGRITVQTGEHGQLQSSPALAGWVWLGGGLVVLLLIIIAGLVGALVFAPNDEESSRNERLGRNLENTQSALAITAAFLDTRAGGQGTEAAVAAATATALHSRADALVETLTALPSAQAIEAERQLATAVAEMNATQTAFIAEQTSVYQEIFAQRTLIAVAQTVLLPTGSRELVSPDTPITFQTGRELVLLDSYDVPEGTLAGVTFDNSATLQPYQGVVIVTATGRLLYWDLLGTEILPNTISIKDSLVPLELGAVEVTAAAYSPHGDGTIALAFRDGSVEVYADEGGELIISEYFVFETAGAFANHIQFTADGNTLYVSNALSPNLFRWELKEGFPETVETGHDEPISNFAFSPDGRWLATLTSSELFLWDLAGDATAREGPTRFAADASSADNSIVFTSIAFSPTSTYLAAGKSNGEIIFWQLNANNANGIRQISGLISREAAGIQALDFGRDGDVLAAAAGDSLVIWDIRNLNRANEATQTDTLVLTPSPGSTARPIAVLMKRIESAHEGVTLDWLAFAPGGALLVSRSTDGALKVWGDALCATRYRADGSAEIITFKIPDTNSRDAVINIRDRTFGINGSYINPQSLNKWWRIGDGRWVRDEDIALRGDCTLTMPYILSIPR